MAPQLLWIGLGNMGRPMCRNLVEKGSLEKPLLVYNRTKARSDDFVALVGPTKAKASESLEESVASADIIFSCLSNDSAVIQTFESIINSGATKGKLFVDCSTIHPDSVEKVAKMVIDAGAEFVSSPVFGPPQMAEKGTLLFAMAGSKSSLEKVRPFIKGVMGQGEISSEDKAISDSAKLKLIGNTFAFNTITHLAESLTVAEKVGLDPATVKQLADVMYGGLYSTYSARMIDGSYWKLEEPFFSANNALKDATHALNLARDANTELKNSKVGLGYLKQLIEIVGGEKGDISAIYGVVRKENGLPFKNDA